MAMDTLPAVWFLFNLAAGKNIEYFPGIFIAIPLLSLLFYTVFIKRQKNISSYIWYIILTVSMVQAYYMIEGPWNRMHIFLYFLVSILSFRLLHHFFHDKRLYVFSFLLASIIGVMDECLQFFSVHRGFSLLDIKADACAALLGQLFLMLVVRPGLKPWIPKLKKKIEGYHAQEKWIKRQKLPVF
jgi:VanZ family protein